MVIGVGTDIELVKRFHKDEIGRDFLNLVFTDRELDYCYNKKEPERSLAGKFCAKESIIKSFNNKISVKDIEIINDKDGKILVYINGKQEKYIFCSISHIEEYAIAFSINMISDENSYESPLPISSVTVKIMSENIHDTVRKQRETNKINISFGEIITQAIGKALIHYPELYSKSMFSMGFLINMGSGTRAISINCEDLSSLKNVSLKIKDGIMAYLRGTLNDFKRNSDLISITNLSPFNGFNVSPAILKGQVGMIAICSEYEHLTIYKGDLVSKKIFNLTMSFNNKKIDCQRALGFLNKVKTLLELK